MKKLIKKIIAVMLVCIMIPSTAFAEAVCEGEIESEETAGEEVAEILSNLDIAPNAINFIIGSEEVTATRTDVTWHVEGFSDLDIITGTKHAFTVNGKSQVDYEGDYYPITSMRDKNEKLAINLAKKTLKGFDRYEVHIWK